MVGVNGKDDQQLGMRDDGRINASFFICEWVDGGRGRRCSGSEAAIRDG